MADVVNLRLARKRKLREERERQAGENRARYGRTRAERQGLSAEESRLKRHLDLHRREDGREE